MKETKEPEGMDLSTFMETMRQRQETTQDRIKAIMAETAEYRRNTTEMAKQCRQMKAAYHEAKKKHPSQQTI